ncbi:hypothetical protein H2201_003895 [Coniosporium apollinis]|uniref:Zn(2)-C6 fungal-type domain-containing protein n=1 Tax=Coniosporium apollinis TaxID=61459 RepID=A0ABQ9NU80_9PEZI|nr:hypothetical protein H2201_003895 [Coniosporium apollinis]
MSFARRDLLQRHYTVHGRDSNNQEGLPANNGMIPKSAGRTPIACSNCAKTKTKCDKKFPCSRCAGRNLKCTLRPTRRASKNVNRIPAPGEGTGSGSSSEKGDITAPGSARTSPQPQSDSSNTTPDEKPLTEGQPSFFEHSPQNVQAQMLPTVLSPLPTPGNGFIQHTPMSGYEDFIRTGREGPEHSSPRFMVEWAQMQMAPGFDAMGRPDMMMAAEMGLDMNGIPGPHTDGMMTMMPELTHALPPVQTPLATPRLDGTFSDMELGSSAALFYPHNGNLAVAHDAGVPDLGAIIAAQDGWTVFRCTPPIPSSSCPKTAKLNLERLEQSLRNHESWSSWRPTWDESDFAAGEQVTVMQLHESSRDKLLAITQTFLHKALDIHKEGMSGSPNSNGSPLSTATNFVLLPPARVLEYFLRSYANSFERYYPLTSKGMLDANELLQCFNDKASSLLVLMMIAQGAMAIPSVEARWLTGGLTEACRISLFDLIEKNIIMASDPVVLHSALLFTVQAAWSGDKWQMDIAMGQRGMYFAMLRHSGVLEPRHAPAPRIDPRGGPEGLWNDWIQQESRSRLIYSWVMVDQDLSLFHDAAPLFSVTEFGAPMPDSDRLWQAKTATEWSEIFNQSMVAQYCQLLSCFSDNVASRQRTRTVTAASTRVRLEEVQTLLQRWYDLATRYTKANPMCTMMQATLVMFHLISLNAVTNFPEIERLARREGTDGTYQQLIWLHKRCISDVEESIFHCGQILRLVRSMPRGIRPPWWPGAIYRVALILWTDSLTHNESITPSSGMFPVAGPSFAVDALPAEHPLVVRYLTKREGVPTLTKRDGTQIPMDHAYTVLSHCVAVIDEGVATRFSDGIRGKLLRLVNG